MRFFRPSVRGAALSLALVVLASCGGDSGTGPFDGSLFMKLRVNGTLYEYSLSGGLLAAFAGGGTNYNLAITGNDGGSSHVTLQALDTSPVSVGTYTGFTITTGVEGALMTFHDPSGVDYDVDVSIPGTVATIVITEISANQVAGTFTATLGATGQANVSITEGSFRVARVN
jgi:hypothetical protein